jgi:hypothetical protein
LNTGLPAALLALVVGSAQAAPPPSPCTLVDPARVRALAPGLAGTLSADEPGTLTPRELPALPVALRLDQCTSAQAADGAIGFRLGLLTAPRELSPAEWAAVARALDHAGPMAPSAAQCELLSEPRRKGGALHTASCGQTRGRHRMDIGFEHTHPAQLPSLDAVRSLLAAALARL